MTVSRRSRSSSGTVTGISPESGPELASCWHRWTALCLLAYLYLAVAVAVQRQHDAGSGLDDGLIPVTVPELLQLLRGIVIPPPRLDRPHRLHWSAWRRRHQHRARTCHYQRQSMRL